MHFCERCSVIAALAILGVFALVLIITDLRVSYVRNQRAIENMRRQRGTRW